MSKVRKKMIILFLHKVTTLIVKYILDHGHDSQFSLKLFALLKNLNKIQAKHFINKI